jgi:Zn-dependent protease with chaperone function
LDFFEQQDLSRRASRRLVWAYLLAVAFALASYGAAAAALYALFALYSTGEARAPWEVPALAAAAAGACVLCVSAYRFWQFREGGHAVADLLGARLVDPQRCTAAERRLVNVVEEMAIASGVAVPPVYLMQHEQAVNALVAGYSPNEAAIVVTRGALDKLSRDELQGVMGHEFSHLLNGDMALNLRLAALLAGLTWIGEQGEALIFGAARMKRAQGADSTAALPGLAGVAIAFIGFPGTLAASALRAAVSRERELLADAGSVQFTRNPDAIAGALDSILALPAHTAILTAHAEGLSHMFFATAVAHWYGFPTHPPIAERIRRAHPRFQRDDYRATRHGRRREVAVIDGSGQVVKHVRSLELLAAVGRPRAEHVDFGRRLLERLPTRLREALHSPEEAGQVLLALGGFRDAAGDLHVYVEALAREHLLTLAELAVPAMRSQPQAARDRFLAEFAARIEADGRVTRSEFVLLTYLRQRLRAGAGEPIPTRFREIREVADDAHAVLSLISLASGDGAGKAFTEAGAVLKLGWTVPLGAQALTSGRVGAALERLRHLAPFAKPALLKACVRAAAADGQLNLAEAELVRTVAATLDCPMPPILPA